MSSSFCVEWIVVKKTCTSLRRRQSEFVASDRTVERRNTEMLFCLFVYECSQRGSLRFPRSPDSLELVYYRNRLKDPRVPGANSVRETKQTIYFRIRFVSLRSSGEIRYISKAVWSNALSKEHRSFHVFRTFAVTHVLIVKTTSSIYTETVSTGVVYDTYETRITAGTVWLKWASPFDVVVYCALIPIRRGLAASVVRGGMPPIRTSSSTIDRPHSYH